MNEFDTLVVHGASEPDPQYHAVNVPMGYPVTMTHGAIPKEERDRIGITENFLRLSVGIEDKEMLRDDLEQAFVAAKR